MKAYVVPDEVTMQRLGRDVKVQLRDRLLASLAALDVPRAVVAWSDRRHYAQHLDPTRVADDARRLLAVMPAEAQDVIDERRALLLKAVS